MSSWLGTMKKGPELGAKEARELNIEEFKQETKFINDNWHPTNRLTLCVFLATAWREFVNKVGGPSEFAQLPRSIRMEHFKKILNQMLFWQQEADRLRTQGGDGRTMDAICQRLAHHFLGPYLAAIINADAESECMLADQLDAYLVEGWGISWGAFPVAGDEAHFPIKEPSKPTHRFRRTSE
jgi:hypothetical protein